MPQVELRSGSARRLGETKNLVLASSTLQIRVRSRVLPCTEAAGEAHGLRVELSEGSVTLPLVSKTRRPWAQRTDGYPHIVAMGLGGHAVATSGVTASGSTGRKPSGLRLDARTQAFGLTSLR